MRQQDWAETVATEQAARYERNLPQWRAKVRGKLCARLWAESRVIAGMQERIRQPWLDRYFLYTSSLGTPTFFMILLPAFFFFGYGEFGRGHDFNLPPSLPGTQPTHRLLTVLSLGAYLSSVVKDLICSPRPFAPPVTRLSIVPPLLRLIDESKPNFPPAIGSHHLEYGFPSTHSTNSVSAALFLFSYIHRLASTSGLSPHFNPLPLNSSTTSPQGLFTPIFLSTEDDPASPIISFGLYILSSTLLIFYAFSIVFGRLYTGMHSFTDCFAGVTLGTAIWWVHTSWAAFPVIFSADNFLYPLLTRIYPTQSPDGYPITIHLLRGLGGGEWLENWVRGGAWEVPSLLILICFLAVTLHPQPIDDCPCFEDAIAGLSVMLGILLSLWAGNYTKLGVEFRTTAIMPGSGWAEIDGRWTQVERGDRDIFVWWAFALLKLTVGILVIFLWRLLAKAPLHRILPLTFRVISRIFRLPRRFYNPASDYNKVPASFHMADSNSELHLVPSILDLPNATTIGREVGGIGSGATGTSATRGTLKIRTSSARAEPPLTTTNSRTIVDHQDPNVKTVKHHDVDVITKVVVYAGIAVLAAEGIPSAFAILGWGVRSSM